MSTLAPFIVRDVRDLPPPGVRPALLIAARVTEVDGEVAQHLAIASEQAMPKPTVRQRLAAKLKSFAVAETPAPAPFDTAGYYPVRRPPARAA